MALATDACLQAILCVVRLCCGFFGNYHVGVSCNGDCMGEIDAYCGESIGKCLPWHV